MNHPHPEVRLLAVDLVLKIHEKVKGDAVRNILTEHSNEIKRNLLETIF